MSSSLVHGEFRDLYTRQHSLAVVQISIKHNKYILYKSTPLGSSESAFRVLDKISLIIHKHDGTKS